MIVRPLGGYIKQPLYKEPKKYAAPAYGPAPLPKPAFNYDAKAYAPPPPPPIHASDYDVQAYGPPGPAYSPKPYKPATAYQAKSEDYRSTERRPDASAYEDPAYGPGYKSFTPREYEDPKYETREKYIPPNYEHR